MTPYSLAALPVTMSQFEKLQTTGITVNPKINLSGGNGINVQDFDLTSVVCVETKTIDGSKDEIIISCSALIKCNGTTTAEYKIDTRADLEETKLRLPPAPDASATALPVALATKTVVDTEAQKLALERELKLGVVLKEYLKNYNNLQVLKEEKKIMEYINNIGSDNDYNVYSGVTVGNKDTALAALETAYTNDTNDEAKELKKTYDTYEKLFKADTNLQTKITDDENKLIDMKKSIKNEFNLLDDSLFDPSVISNLKGGGCEYYYYNPLSIGDSNKEMKPMVVILKDDFDMKIEQYGTLFIYRVGKNTK
jgi:hypothetical protein